MQAVQRDFNNMCCIQYLGKRNFKHFSVQNPERKKWRGTEEGGQPNEFQKQLPWK